MSFARCRSLVLICALGLVSAACASSPGAEGLVNVAVSARQWTGVAVSAEERVFVNFPRWSDDVPASVGELIGDDVVVYPNAEMQAWAPGKDPATHFVCVQSVHVDAANRLWILDPASPRFEGVVPGGPKLLQVDLATDEVVRVYRFGPDVAPPDSYLNDVRIDVARKHAYITDSGNGALVVLDLVTAEARRVLDDHPSTEAERVTLIIGKRPWLMGGKPPKIHADGIAYDAANDVVYYQALTGRTMYRIDGAALRDASLDDEALAARVRRVGKTGASDGLIFGPDGMVYISALEFDAIRRTTPDGQVEMFVQDESISWPDSFALGPGGMLWFTTARIHEGAKPKKPYGLHRIRIP